MAKYNLTAKVSIDITERTVRVVKTGGGLIVSTGTAELPRGLPEPPSAEYSEALSQAIKNAAAAAKAPKGGNCVVVVGGPHIITRNFTWPEMSADAMAVNAETEMVPYLPSGASSFTIDYTVVRRREVPASMGDSAVMVEVLVAAISNDVAQSIVSASAKAGFNPKRLDIRENARSKLIHTSILWGSERNIFGPSAGIELPTEYLDIISKSYFDPAKSFAILDITDSPANMSVFINGSFYVSRYFTVDSMAMASAAPAALDPAFAGYGGYAAPASGAGTDFYGGGSANPYGGGSPYGGGAYGGGNPYGNPYGGSSYGAPAGYPMFDTDSLVTEVSSIIDYIHYQERGSHVGSILLFGDADKVPNLIPSLMSNLDIPIFKAADKLMSILAPAKRGMVNVATFLDAFGAVMEPPNKLSPDIDLKTKKRKPKTTAAAASSVRSSASTKKAAKKLMPVAAVVLVLLLAAGIIVPYLTVSDLEKKTADLDSQIDSYMLIPQELVTAMEAEVGTIQSQFDEIYSFFHAYPPSSMVLSELYGLLPYGAEINRISINDDRVTVNGYASSVLTFYQMVVSIRRDYMFAGVGISSINPGAQVEYSIVLALSQYWEMTELLGGGE